MIPVKDVRKVFLDTETAKSLADLQAMFGGVIGVNAISNNSANGYIQAIEFSQNVDGLTVSAGGSSAKLHLISGETLSGSDVVEGAKIPFYFVKYISLM